jgi:hypothetical protein
MNWMSRSARELWGLFVEDATFTVAIVAAVVISAVGFPRIRLPDGVRGPGLFLLVVIVLLENVARSARPARRGTTE